MHPALHITKQMTQSNFYFLYFAIKFNVNKLFYILCFRKTFFILFLLFFLNNKYKNNFFFLSFPSFPIKRKTESAI